MTSVQRTEKILPTVEVDGHSFYKSTFVSELNGNVFLSKDRLASIKYSIQFNNHNNCLEARSDRGVPFVQRSTTRLLSTVKSVAKRKRGRVITVVKAINATNILNGVDSSSWWVKRVQAMRRCNGK